ncbi:MAG: hypothetical protein KDA44_10735, partial [Planctomycetales bacterium]|nr:hypothetical protein [Planctomycetales bacterium]
ALDAQGDAQNMRRVMQVSAGVDATISGVTITGGWFDASGGTAGAGIYSEGNLRVEGVVFDGNVTGRSGGGLYQYGGALEVIDSEFLNNTAAWGGGGCFYTNDTTDGILISGSTFHDNHAVTNGSAGSGTGGGMLIGGVASAPIKVVNSTISTNDAALQGGGFAVNGSSTLTTFVNATVVRNTTAGAGGGLSTLGRTVTLHNTILAENTNSATMAASNIAGTLAAASSYNLLGTGVSLPAGAGNFTAADAGLGDLADNGGPTPTHAPLAGSPAFDSGSIGILTDLAITLDQRGLPRVIDSDLDGVAAPEIGAYEGDADEYFASLSA